MPGPASAPAADVRGLAWVRIDNFTPGIWSQSNFAYQAGAAVPAPPGAAQEDGTWGCLPLPSGALGPGLGLTATYLPPEDAVQDGITNWVTGAQIFGRVVSWDDIVYGLESVDGSNQRRFNLMSLFPQIDTTLTLETLGPATSTTAAVPWATTGGLTMVNTTAPYTARGNACCAIGYTFVQDSGIVSYLWLYPDPANPGAGPTPGTISLPGGVGIGRIVLHQNRIVNLSDELYLWGGTVDGQTAALAGEMEQFYYTDPPNSNVMGTQDEVFVQEHPQGVGCWGSISAGELFLVKRQGGGYIISGDLNSPTVTYLPGVVPTYDLDCESVSCPAGLVYLSQNNGAWLWNGSSVSTKISGQLRDDFFMGHLGANFGPKGSLAAWGNYVVLPNNWIYDIQAASWWRLDNQAVPFAWAGYSYDGAALYLLPPSITEHTDPVVYEYSRTSPANRFQWQSFPLAVSRDRAITVREVVIRAQGTGQVSVTLTGVDGTAASSTPAAGVFDSPTQPAIVPLAVGITAHDVTVTVESVGDSSGPAPVIYSIDVGYADQLPAGRT